MSAIFGDTAASIKSEKSKDIRSTNIIAAKGKSRFWELQEDSRVSDSLLTFFSCYSRRWCRENLSRT